MNKQWKLTLAAAVVCLTTLTVPFAETGTAVPDEAELPGVEAAQASERNLVAIHVDADRQGQPLITLDADGELDYESFVLGGPDRLVIDLAGVISRLDRYSFPVETGGVVQVRAAQHQIEPEPITRVVFDLERAVDYRIEPDGSGLAVTFGDQAEPVRTEPVAVEIEEVPEPVSVAALEPEPESEPEKEPAPEPEPEPAEPVAPVASRAVEPEAIEQLLSAPPLAAPAEQTTAELPASFETKTIAGDVTHYTGKRISLNLVDADIKQVFRLFHEISGLNFVLDPDVSGKITIVLDQVPWDQALDLILKNNGLDKELERNVLRIASTTKLAQEAAARKQLREAAELEVEPITLTRTLSYAKALEVEQVIRDGGVLTARGKVIVDERTNTLIISDIAKKVEPLDELISTLDAETPQVMIEARIVETSRSFVRNLGVSWGFTAAADAAHGTATGLAFPHNASASYALNLPGQEASTLSLSFGNVVDSFTLDVALNALETQGETRILSSPKVTTQNNERAEIEQGVRIPIVNTTATEINVEFVSASLKLTVTPQITAEGTVILDVIVENNSPDFINTAADIPSIRTQRAQTKVLVTDGGTTVIGGIFTVNDGQSEVGVPWFRKIPVFGWLFRSQEISKENRELLIFITPKIVKLS